MGPRPILPATGIAAVANEKSPRAGTSLANLPPLPRAPRGACRTGQGRTATAPAVEYTPRTANSIVNRVGRASRSATGAARPAAPIDPGPGPRPAPRLRARVRPISIRQAGD